MKVNRRQAVLGLSSTALLPIGCSTVRIDQQPFANEVFAHGVASGDPDQTSVVLWTRVSGARAPVSVNWQVSARPDMADPVAAGRFETGEHRDYTVKVVPEGLAPGRTWYYRFESGGVQSPTGRTRTLPEGTLDELVIAVASCSNYPFGYFNGYEAIAEDPEVDIVVHLGDYLYEYDEDGYGGDDGRRLGRIHNPRHEIVSLDDYRTRHAQYKAEPGSLAMHAMHPLIHTWDDHESTNNPWKDGAQNHQPDEGDWRARRARSLRAYYEWMPSRDPAPGRAPEERWGHFKFGNLLSLYTLESRHTARSEQVDLAAYRDQFTSPEVARAIFDRVVGAPERRMLSSRMEQFLRRELEESVTAGRRWRILANQTILANVIQPDIDEPGFNVFRPEQPESNAGLLDNLTAAGKLGLAINMDAWDGYPAARERLYELAKDAGARDLLVITGDTHVFWQNQLFTDSGERMGVELGTSGITSPRGFYGLGAGAANRLDELVAARNESVVWSDGRYRGYIRLTLTPYAAQAEFIRLSTIESPAFATDTLRRVTIVQRDGTLHYA